MSFPSLPEPPPPTGSDATLAEPTESPPAPKTRLFLVFVTCVLLLSGIAAVGIWLFRPVPCSSKSFVSPQFAYCVNAPAGWTAVTDQSSRAPFDSFLLSNGAGTMTVRSVQISASMDLNAFGMGVYQLDQQPGLEVGKPSATRVGGQPAVQWDITDSAQHLASREVLVVKDGHAWRITFADDQSSFQKDSAAFRQLLDSWEFQ